jgi:hypothetical protein
MLFSLFQFGIDLLKLPLTAPMHLSCDECSGQRYGPPHPPSLELSLLSSVIPYSSSLPIKSPPEQTNKEPSSHTPSKHPHISLYISVHP